MTGISTSISPSPSIQYKDKPLGCPHHWHQEDVICSETNKPIETISERWCCICNAEQYILT